MASSLQASSEHDPLHFSSCSSSLSSINVSPCLKLCYLSRTKLSSVSISQLTFSKLLSLVAQAFPEIENSHSSPGKPNDIEEANKIELSYNDADGDTVVIDSDESLKLAALSFQKSHVDAIKFYINVKNDQIIYDNTGKAQTSTLTWQSSRIPCRHFQAGSCRLGRSCSFLHQATHHNELPSGQSGSLLDESEIKEQTSMNRKPRIPCRNFQAGLCRFGSSCTFLHQVATHNSDKSGSLLDEPEIKVQTSMNRQSRIPCRHFQAGSCRFGTSCTFLHQATRNGSSTGKSGSDEQIGGPSLTTLRRTTSSSKTRKEDADANSSAPASAFAFHRPSSFKPSFFSILETSHEGTSTVTTSTSRTRTDGDSTRASSSRTREENERLKAELEKFIQEYSSGGKAISVAATSSKTRLEMEALKKELTNMKASARTSRLREINQMVRAVQELDLAFLFDATGSMKRYMKVVKEKILKIAHEICDAFPESLIRVAFVFYRDYSDMESCGSCDFTIDFSGSHSTFVQALACVETKSNEDTAEDVFSGLEALAKLNWTSHNRVVYHIADAPCHGTRFHEPNVSDNYPKGDLKGRDITTLLRILREACKLSTYTFLHITEQTRKMLREFKQAVGVDSTWICEDEFKDIDDIPAKVVTACTSTISHSLSTMTSARMRMEIVKFVPRQVRTEMPKWDDIKVQEGEVYKFKRYGDVQEVLRDIKGGVPLELEKTESVQVQVGLDPFSGDGASRWPFYAQIVTHEYDTKVMVVKRFKDKIGGDSAKLHTKEKYTEQMEVQAVSALLAEDFNSCISHIYEAKKVTFTSVSTLKVQSMYYNMEKVLTGLWTKFNSNAGYVNDVESYTDTLQAFSHWTHQRSKGVVMVTDLQGVQISSVGTRAFLLCDPAIHSRDVLRFTRTNLGEKGFELFYKSHKCNIICKKLGLKPSTHTP